MSNNQTRAIKLDWSRLLGFDQAAPTRDGGGVRLADARLAKLGAKLGDKRPPPPPSG